MRQIGVKKSIKCDKKIDRAIQFDAFRDMNERLVNKRDGKHKMARMNLKKLSISELEELRNEIEQTIIMNREEKRLAIKEQVEAIILEAGFTVDEVFGKIKGKKAPRPPKYRNPDDPSQTYSGMGRKPGWLVEKLEAGAEIDDFLIG